MVVEFFLGRWVHLGSSGLSGAVAGLIGVHPEVRQFHQGLLGLLWCT